MASNNEEVSNKRKITDEEEEQQQHKEKEAKVADPLTDTVLAVNIKINDMWIRINKALTEAKVRSCTLYGPGEMHWKYGVYNVVFCVVAFYNYDAKDVTAGYKITYYDPPVKHEHFTEAQQAETIAFLKKQIERARAFAVRSDVVSYVDKEASHWRVLMREIISDPALPFSPTLERDGDHIWLQWKTDATCVVVERVLNNGETCFTVTRPQSLIVDPRVHVFRHYTDKPESVIATVKQWLA